MVKIYEHVKVWLNRKTSTSVVPNEVADTEQIPKAGDDFCRPPEYKQQIVSFCSLHPIPGIDIRTLRAYELSVRASAENMAFLAMIVVYWSAKLFDNMMLQHFLFPTNLAIYFLLLSFLNSVALRATFSFVIRKRWKLYLRRSLVFGSPFNPTALALWFAPLLVSMFAICYPTGFGWYLQQLKVGPFAN